VPRRFQLITNTVDPGAQLWRGRGGGSGEAGAEAAGEPGAAAAGQRSHARGLWDPEVIGVLADGRVQPFRLLEFDAIGGRDEPLPADGARQMWFQARQMFPMTLESVGLPGYGLLDVHDTTLGRLDALAFEYRWEGLRPDEDGGDHALLVWAPTPWTVFHVYYHCSENEWAARLPELEEILATFRVIDE
jgi:hypothetical protein